MGRICWLKDAEARLTSFPKVEVVSANAKMSEIVSLCSDNVRLSVQRFCPLV